MSTPETHAANDHAATEKILLPVPTGTIELLDSIAGRLGLTPDDVAAKALLTYLRATQAELDAKELGTAHDGLYHVARTNRTALQGFMEEIADGTHMLPASSNPRPDA